jgi:zinc protease
MLLREIFPPAVACISARQARRTCKPVHSPVKRAANAARHPDPAPMPDRLSQREVAAVPAACHANPVPHIMKQVVISASAFRTWSRPIACALAAVLLAAPGLSAQRLTLESSMRDTVLANGLRVIVVPNPTVPLVTIQVTIRNGAFTQLTQGDEGVPHLLEHMLFRSFSSFFSEASKLNAGANGTTSDETVTYYLTLPSSNLDGGVKLLADLMRSPRFEKDALESEQKVVRGELERAVSNPAYLLHAMVDQKLWGQGWGRKNAIGNILTINGADTDRLKKMYERFYVPNNSAVVFSGDVSAADAFASAGRRFSSWRRGNDPFEGLAMAPMPELASHQEVIVNLEANDVTMLIRWQGPSVATDPASTYAADVFASIVNDPVSDFQVRLVDSGLFQSISMDYQTRAHVGPISINALTTPDQVAAASAALRAELDRFSDPGYVTSELIEIAKKRREVDWAMAMETPSSMADFVGDMWSIAGLDYTRGYLGTMQAQTEADVEKFVARYISNRPRVTGIMLSPATRREIGSQLEAALAPWRK